MSIEKLTAWTSELRPEIKSNVTPHGPDDAPNGLVHIVTRKGVTEFVPNVSRRVGNKEDNTITRITVATSLVGAIVGCASMEYNFSEFTPDKKMKSDYQGMYYIHKFAGVPFLEPKTKLLYDVKASGERWLVPYLSVGQTYQSVLAGSMFLQCLITYPKPDWETEDIRGVIYLELTEAIQFNTKQVLGPGYYKVVGPIDNRHLTMNENTFIITSVNKSEFYSEKKLMENPSIERPITARW